MRGSNEWKLKSIELEFKGYGDDKGKYVGSIQFQNGEHESFRFKIRPDMAEAYINLIAEDVVKAASSLSERLIDSLGLKKKEGGDVA